MAGQIRITPEQLRERGATVQRHASDFERTIGEMDTLITGLQDEWEGQASNEYREQFVRLKPAFNDMKQLMDTMGIQLNETANALEELDRDISKKFRG